MRAWIHHFYKVSRHRERGSIICCMGSSLGEHAPFFVREIMASKARIHSFREGSWPQERGADRETNTWSTLELREHGLEVKKPIRALATR